MTESERRMQKRVLILSHDTVGAHMAGPGMRYHQIALELSRHFEVTLAVLNPTYISSQPENLPYKSVHMDVHQFRPVFDQYDAVFALWLSDDMMDYASSKGILTIFDMYAPVPVENLIAKFYSHTPYQLTDDLHYLDSIAMYKRFFEMGDFFVCSNQRQRDYWLGFMFASNLVTPSSYQQDQVDERVVLSPMGTNLDEDVPVKLLLRDRIGAAPSDTVLIWTGGIWDWFDAQTVIRAMAELVDTPAIKLVFLATKHPNADVPEMAETVQARKLADQLGLTGSTVFFLDGWLGYDERLAYFKDATAAIFAHKSALEAEFSHRTRVLDHILIGLPTICTRGDYFADVIERDNFGLVAPAGDIPAMKAAIVNMSQPGVADSFHQQIMAAREPYTWTAVLKPVVDFIKHGTPKPRTARPVASQTKPQMYRLAKRLPRPLKKILKPLANRLLGR